MDLSQHYRNVRRATEALAAPLSPEDCAIQSMADASPVKWHLAHTTWFFETMVLESALADFSPFDPHFRVLFNSYYNGVGEQYSRPDRGLLSRPGLDEVMAYRRHVDRGVLALLETENGPDDVVTLGLHHEQQHQELILTDVKHALSCNPMQPAYLEAKPAAAEEPPAPGWQRQAEGLEWLGHDGDGFAFDNETPRHRSFVEAFELATRPVTVGEYLAFMDDGGYSRPELWLSDGCATLAERGWQAPLYWQLGGSGWTALTLGGTRPVEPAEPVCHVSFYEADAYARWAGARLPSEAEWEVAATGAIDGNFVENGHLHPRPSPASNGRPSALFGDVWEWTRSAYQPYPGFKPLAGALGEYNGKFMSGQMVLRGGSCATPISHIRRSYRNFFHPDARWQFSGIRLARDA